MTHIKFTARILFWGIIIGLFQLGNGLNAQSIQLEIGTGGSTGWWIYNRGTSDPDVFNDQGYDRTHHSLFLPARAGIIFQKGNLTLGLGAEHIWIFEDIMYRYNDRAGIPAQYAISDGFVKVLKLGGKVEYTLFQKGAFQFSPTLGAGTFRINTLHPEKDNFGTKWYWEIGIANTFALGSGLDLVATPVYKTMRIAVENPQYPQEKHELLSFGLDVSLRITLANFKQ